jgi:hypothetical protein
MPGERERCDVMSVDVGCGCVMIESESEEGRQSDREAEGLICLPR